MSFKASIIIPTFQRAHLLKWNLYSLAKQSIPFSFETIVVNDGYEDETKDICNEYREKLNLKYVFSGQRNHDGKAKWRVPGFAINIGVKQSSGEVLIICCAEMFHINDTIPKLISPLQENNKLLGIPEGRKDHDGSFLEYLNRNNGNIDAKVFDNYPILSVNIPYLMSISRKEFYAIGGYDEDFTGVSAEDNDLINRLLFIGCRHIKTEAKTIHLYHPRYFDEPEAGPRIAYNLELYFSKYREIVRNKNREWGKL